MGSSGVFVGSSGVSVGSSGVLVGSRGFLVDMGCILVVHTSSRVLEVLEKREEHFKRKVGYLFSFPLSLTPTLIHLQRDDSDQGWEGRAGHT